MNTMTHNLLLISIGFLFSSNSHAQSEYILDFDVEYTYAVWHSPPTFQLPADTSINVRFTPRASTTLLQSGGITSLRLATGSHAVSADSPIFNALPSPQISWNSPNTGGEVRVERNDSTSEYRLIVVSDLSYSLNCVLTCTNYFKAVTLISDYLAGLNYLPFDDPARFISDLNVRGTSFESSVIQNSWYRVSGRTYYSGAYLSTSYNTLGLGQYWQGGNAKISSLTTPVPEPETGVLLLIGILSIGYQVRTLNPLHILNRDFTSRYFSGDEVGKPIA